MDMRQEIIDFMEESNDNFMKAWTYLNGNLCQCYTHQAEYIIENEDELPDHSVEELYHYLFN